MDNHRLPDAAVKTSRPPFVLPRKGNSAVRLIKPKDDKRHQIHHPEVSSSVKLERASENSEDGATSRRTYASAARARQSSKGAEQIRSASNESKQVKHERKTGQSVPGPHLTPSLHLQGRTLDEIQNSVDQPPQNGLSSPSSREKPMVVDTNGSLLDVYAKNYIPQYLTAINESQAQLYFSMALPTIDFSQYVSSFAGSSILSAVRLIPPPPIDPDHLHPTISTEILVEDNYSDYLVGRIERELTARVLELRELSIYNISFNIVDQLRGLYGFIIPGLREYTPRIDLGDIVRVRPWICLSSNGLSELAKAWYSAGGRQSGRVAPGFCGFEYRAVVWRLQRSTEKIVLKMDGFVPRPGQVCNLIFVVQNHQNEPMFRNITSTCEELRRADQRRSWIQKMLFPLPTDGLNQETLSKGSFDLTWFDTRLNFEQKKAVDAVVQGQYGVLPFLISGPPGTGKTKTLVEITMQLLRSADIAGKRCHLLVCAPSDSAADTIATRLKVHLNPKELFRLNGWTRSFVEVPEPLMIYSRTQEDLFSIPDFNTMMAYKVVVTTCRDADMLVQARLGNADLAKLTKQLAAINPDSPSRPPLLHWSALLLDEAAQATEPEALIPLMVISPEHEEAQPSQTQPRFIMAGDEHQLGPRLSLKSKEGLEKPLFQRLFERTIYSEHPLSRKNGFRPLTASMLPLLRPPFINLIRNYRSHPAILSIPSKLFYYDTLVPEVTQISPAVTAWPGWKASRRWPVLFVQNNSPDAVESILAGNGTGAGALINAGEAVIAEELVKSLTTPTDTFPGVPPHEITVISAFRAQVNLLRQRFRKSELHSVNIGPLEAFQGLESRIVIICTTRTRRDHRNPARFVQEDEARGIGLIGDRKKFNVALTRAKEGLIVIGDQECLTLTDPCWAAFIAFCQRNGCVRGKSTELVKSDIPLGRMERALNYTGQGNARTSMQGRLGHPTPRGVLRGNIPTADEEMWTDGIVAQEQDEGIEDDDDDDDDNVVDASEEHIPKENIEDEDGHNNDRDRDDHTPHVSSTAALSHLVKAPSPSTAPANTIINNNVERLINSSPDSNSLRGQRGEGEEEDVSGFHFDRNPEDELRASGCEQQ